MSSTGIREKIIQYAESKGKDVRTAGGITTIDMKHSKIIIGADNVAMYVFPHPMMKNANNTRVIRTLKELKTLVDSKPMYLKDLKI